MVYLDCILYYTENVVIKLLTYSGAKPVFTLVSGVTVVHVHTFPIDD